MERLVEVKAWDGLKAGMWGGPAQLD
jgi:hypothetical protein